MNNKMALDICAESTEQGGKLLLYPLHGKINQQFEFRDNNIISVNSNLVLEVSGKLESGSYVVQATPNGGDKQKFFLSKDGTIKTINGLCLESEHQKTATKGQIVIREPNGCDSQKFRCVTSI